jgi:hypothetical protein
MAKGKSIPEKKAPKKAVNKAEKAKGEPVSTVQPPAAAQSAIGRPSKYDPAYCAQVTKLCKLGATDKEIAEFFEVAESTIYLWKVEHKDFSEAITRGKMVADMEVAASLYKTAVGFHYKEKTTGVNDMGSFINESRRYATPDFRAIRFWLMNRQKDKWRDKVEQDITSNGQSINKPMSDEQFNKIVNMLNGTESSQGERVEKTT